MSNEDLKVTIDAIRSLRKELTSSPEKALAYLIQSGIVKTKPLLG